jgi:large-conductance mechanosensitive channel
MPRKSRSAPALEDPLEAYSTWDIRIAKIIYYGFILATAILVLGIWGLILDWVIRTGKWDFFVDLELGYQIAIISGAVTGHLFLLVLFYILFRGGMVRFCRILYKDRLVAKKWEDYYGLRMLVGVALLGLYITLVSLAIGLLPTVFFNTIGDLWLWMVREFRIGEWILWVGSMVLLIVGFVFIALMIWNHGVFWVLRHVKEIEQEIEIEEQIKKDAIKNADERTLRDIYKKETGQKPIYRGKETSGYKEWKEKLKV